VPDVYSRAQQDKYQIRVWRISGCKPLYFGETGNLVICAVHVTATRLFADGTSLFPWI